MRRKRSAKGSHKGITEKIQNLQNTLVLYEGLIEKLKNQLGEHEEERVLHEIMVDKDVREPLTKWVNDVRAIIAEVETVKNKSFRVKAKTTNKVQQLVDDQAKIRKYIAQVIINVKLYYPKLLAANDNQFGLREEQEAGKSEEVLTDEFADLQEQVQEGGKLELPKWITEASESSEGDDFSVEVEEGENPNKLPKEVIYEDESSEEVEDHTRRGLPKEVLKEDESEEEHGQQKGSDSSGPRF